MMNTPANTVAVPSLQRVAASLLICALLVTVCYVWIDPAFAFWVDRADLRRFRFFEYCTHLDDAVLWATALYYLCFALNPQRGAPASRAGLNIAISVTVGVFVKDALKIVFGRYWPATWVNHNPSLLHDNAYGFHWFHAGTAYQSFPSGHTTVACSAAAAVWFAFPRWRIPAVLAAALVVLGLLANDYHFVGDCIAGAWLGTVVALYVHTASSSLRSHPLPPAIPDAPAP